MSQPNSFLSTTKTYPTLLLLLILCRTTRTNRIQRTHRIRAQMSLHRCCTNGWCSVFGRCRRCLRSIRFNRTMWLFIHAVHMSTGQSSLYRLLTQQFNGLTHFSQFTVFTVSCCRELLQSLCHICETLFECSDNVRLEIEENKIVRLTIRMEFESFKSEMGLKSLCSWSTILQILVKVFVQNKN